MAISRAMRRRSSTRTAPRTASRLAARFRAAYLALALCAAALVGLSPAPAAAQECAPYRVDFRFRTASPVSSPLAVDPGGQIYIATHEGYLHALGPDGRFLWSYTVNGALLHGVVADGDQGALLASSKGLVYSLRPNGAARWVFQLPITPEGPLRIDERRAAHFLAGSYLYAVSSRAGVLWRTGFAAAPNGNDFYEASSGETWLTTQDGALHAVRTPARRQQWALGNDFSAAALLGVSADLAFVLSAETLTAVERDGTARFAIPGVRWAAVGEAPAPAHAELVVLSDDAVRFIDVTSGTERSSVPHAAALSAPPALASGRAFLPLNDGHLEIVAADGAVQRCAVAETALDTPIVSVDARRAVVAAGAGVVAALVASEGAP